MRGWQGDWRWLTCRRQGCGGAGCATFQLPHCTVLQVSGSSNAALHDPNRPTFGQAAPLLHAFLAAGCNSNAGGGNTGSGGGSGSGSGSVGGGSFGWRGSHAPVLLGGTGLLQGQGLRAGEHRANRVQCPPAPLLVAHNGGFDARMLIGEFVRRGMEVPRHWRQVCSATAAGAASGTLWFWSCGIPQRIGSQPLRSRMRSGCGRAPAAPPAGAL